MRDIDVSLVGRLVTTQFPQWAGLTIKPVAPGGWDNRTFHLGEHMAVRLQRRRVRRAGAEGAPMVAARRM